MQTGALLVMLLLLLLLVAAASAAQAAAAAAAGVMVDDDLITVDTATGHFVDQHGRVRIFHGVNAVYKVPPYAPDTGAFNPNTSLGATDIANLRRWGFNVVRLGVMWPGWQVAKGVNNATYAARMLQLTRKLGASGIYSIVDMHQDLLSRKTCGEGAPDFLVQYPDGAVAAPFPLPIAFPYSTDHRTHYPSLESCLSRNFAFYYATDAVGQIFQELYENSGGFADHLADFWGNVSSTFKDENQVLAYELINEPWPGSVIRHPRLLEPGVADREHLAPLYAKLHKRVRAADERHIVFFEKALAPGQAAPSGFTSGPGGAAYNDRQALSYHVYCAPIDSDGVPRNVLLCDGEDIAEFEIDLRDARRLGVGAMLTEFGAMLSAERSIENLHYLTSLADANLQSWTYWQMKYFNDLTTQGGAGESLYMEDGKLQTPKLRALTRTYAQAVAGTPGTMFFSPATATFELHFALNTSIAAPTVVYYSRDYYYPAGAHVRVTPANTLTWSEAETGYLVFKPAAGAVTGTSVVVRVTPQ